MKDNLYKNKQNKFEMKIIHVCQNKIKVD